MSVPSTLRGRWLLFGAVRIAERAGAHCFRAFSEYKRGF